MIMINKENEMQQMVATEQTKYLQLVEEHKENQNQYIRVCFYFFVFVDSTE
jgi:hypothetical protein